MNVSDNRRDHIGRDVVGFKKCFGIGHGIGLNIAGIADHRMVIGVGRKGSSHKLFNEPADGPAFRAHPALFHDHVPFFVELTKHRV